MSDAARVTLQSESFTVLDDVLAAEARDALWNYFQLQPFQRVDALGMQGQWPLEDSGVLRGPTVGWNQSWDAQYPTKTPIDSLMRAVFELVAKSDVTVGTYGKDWKSFSASAVIYASGQGRMWHRDADDDAGSWIYYGHPEWNIEWGGELFLAPDLRAPSEFGLYFSPVSFRWPITRIRRHGRAIWTIRTPIDFLWSGRWGPSSRRSRNRMVIIRADTPRATAKIRASAGRHVLASKLEES